ncbi:sugar diacid recognition domain-containing protein [Bacillus sp. B15-48]|uniref:CdaR family transcriptional regulator n=1 Tax=Bacillus sp. B15-48 TaxID=1548601 RepID=UPI00193EEA13|nr:sugar diacid recognition domain-containing protein [Bacillus sp. B15-48]MBM4761047.1 hypothetical protein [Bacillus sp. B15-48]
MKITSELAHPIILKLKALVNYNINIMDEEGVIVASTDPNRMHQIHQGALQVIEKKTPIIIYSGDEKKFYGSKPGVNLPVENQNLIIGVIGVTGDPDETLRFAQILKVTVEVMIQEMELFNRLQYENKIMENWVLDLIHPSDLNRTKLIADGKHYLNINFDQETSVFLIRFPDWKSKKTSDMIHIRKKKDNWLNQIRSFIPKIAFSAFVDDVHCLIGVPYMQENYLSIAQSIKGFFASHKLPVDISIGHSYHGIEGYRKSYFEARDSLQLLDKFPCKEHIAHNSSWGFINLLHQVPIDGLTRFYAQYVSEKTPLNDEQIQTLQALFDCDLNMKCTAESLHIHRNTLLYRLDNIAKQTGLDPKSFHDAMILRFIIVIKKLIV